MIIKYRNNALIGIPIGLLLFSLAITVIIKERGKGLFAEMPDNQIVIVVFSMIGGVMAYFWGCCSLAKARGYDTALVAAVVIMIWVLGSLLNAVAAILILVLPPIVLMFLKDKTLRPSRHL